MTRTRMTLAVAGTLVAAIAISASLSATPATASAAPLAPQLYDTLAASPEFDWNSFETVEAFLASGGAYGDAAPIAGTAVRIVTTDSANKWSTAHLDAVCRAALTEYGVAESEWNWVLAANRNVAFRESGNRPGAKSANGKYWGMHQWNSDWADTERVDGEWSVYRFVKVYADGGKAKIRQHWKATIGDL